MSPEWSFCCLTSEKKSQKNKSNSYLLNINMLASATALINKTSCVVEATTAIILRKARELHKAELGVY